jgi:hypothetical protein
MGIGAGMLGGWEVEYNVDLEPGWHRVDGWEKSGYTPVNSELYIFDLLAAAWGYYSAMFENGPQRELSWPDLAVIE